MQVCDRHPANLDTPLQWCKLDDSGGTNIRHLYRLRHDTDISRNAWMDLVGEKSLNEVLFELGFEMVDENGNVATSAAIEEFLGKAQRNGSLLKVVQPSKLYQVTAENMANRGCIILSSLLPQRIRDDKWLVCAVLEDREEDQVMTLLLQRELELSTLTLVDETSRVPRLLEMQTIAAQSKVALAIQSVHPIRRKGHTLFCYQTEPIEADFLAYLFCVKHDTALVRGLAYGVAQLVLLMYASNITHGHLSIHNTVIRYDTVDNKPQTVVNCFDFTQASCSLPYPELDIVSFLISLSEDLTVRQEYTHFVMIFEDALNDVLKQIRKDKFMRVTPDKALQMQLWAKYKGFRGQLPDEEEAQIEEQEQDEVKQEEEQFQQVYEEKEKEEEEEQAQQEVEEVEKSEKSRSRSRSKYDRTRSNKGRSTRSRTRPEVEAVLAAAFD